MLKTGENMEKIDYLQENKKGALENAERELKQYAEAKAHTEKMREFVEKRIELTKKLFPIVNNNLKNLKPNYAFEETSEFIDVKKELNALDNESELYKMEMELKSLDTKLKSFDKEIAIHTETVEKLSKELGESQ